METSKQLYDFHKFQTIRSSRDSIFNDKFSIN